MEQNASGHQQEQAKRLEEAYHRGYHHGFARARDILLRQMSEGMPAGVALELCRVFVIWRIICQEFTDKLFVWMVRNSYTYVQLLKR